MIDFTAGFFRPDSAGATGAGTQYSRRPDRADFIEGGTFLSSSREVVRTLDRVAPTLIGVGDVRLHNRSEIIESLAGARVDTGALSDLALVFHLLAHRGWEIIATVLGDFALVAWDERRQIGFAARDAFGLKPLYIVTDARNPRLGNRASALTGSVDYDREFIAEYLVHGNNPERRTVFPDVREVPPGSMIVLRPGSITTTQFWSASAFTPATSGRVEELAAQFRDLLARSLYSSLEPGGRAWSQLSGGLDSSSLVSMSEWLVSSGRSAKRLGGTITFTDTLGHADEREFSDAVVSKWSLRNEQIDFGWWWRDDGGAPPATDVPTLGCPLFARDRQMARLVKQQGADVLFSGEGPDYYLSGEPIFVADLVARRRFGDAVSTLVDWAQVRRKSIWSYGAEFGVFPLASRSLRLRHYRSTSVPRWVAPPFRRALDIDSRTHAARRYGGRWGDKYRHMIAYDVSRVFQSTTPGVADTILDVRYPWLYRPLVEFCLCLPPLMRSQPVAQKWLLRQALEGILPDRVRTRTGKGGFGARAIWSLHHERKRIKELLDSSTLADLGCIDVPALRRSISRARRGSSVDSHGLFAALSLETWHAIRTKRWTVDSLRSAEVAGHPARGSADATPLGVA